MIGRQADARALVRQEFNLMLYTGSPQQQPKLAADRVGIFALPAGLLSSLIVVPPVVLGHDGGAKHRTVGGAGERLVHLVERKS